VAYAALAYGYLRLTPAWQNPDEPAHFTYVAFVATTSGLPVLQPGDWDSALLERLKTGRLQPGDDINAIRYESWQPPLYYLIAAPVYALGPPDTALYRLRAFDLVLGGVTLLLGYLVAGEVLAPQLAAAVPMAMAGVPMFTAISASVSADPLANLLAAATSLALLRRWHAIAVGLLIGLGLLTKLELAIFLPLALGWLVLRSPPRWREAVLLLVTVGFLLTPWLIHQITSYGPFDPLALARHSAVVTDQPRFAGFSGAWLQQFATVSFHSFWAQFGWMAIVAPDRLYWIWGALTGLAVVGLIWQRSSLGNSAWRLLLATVVLAFVAYVGYNLNFVQYQSRYLFTALAPIAILLVRGWSAFPPRPWTALTLSAALVAVNAYALLRVLGPGFAPSP
jgi:4-amino-4-deoxy-L-arabinose transferase-like glycosyltransferase